jgi:hypothetical protein
VPGGKRQGKTQGGGRIAGLLRFDLVQATMLETAGRQEPVDFLDAQQPSL